MVSGSISLPFLGFFSPFLHSTGSLSVSQEYLALPDGAGRFTQNFTGSALLRIPTGWFLYVYGTITLYGSNFPVRFHFIHQSVCRSYNPVTLTYYGLGYSAFARHYLRNHYCFLFLRVLRCFSSPGCRLSTPGLQPGRFPYSDICGSKVICTSPQLIAAYHVLRRL